MNDSEGDVHHNESYPQTYRSLFVMQIRDQEVFNLGVYSSDAYFDVL